jgi:hypothetical protein
MLYGHGRLGSDHARFLAASLPKASSIPAAVARPIVGIQWVCHVPAGSLSSYATYCHPLTPVDPNLTLTRMQCPAKVSNRENRNPFTYARFASVCNAQQPLTAHS